MKIIARQLQALRDQIHAMEQKYARLPGSVHLLAVSKARSVEEILATIGCNQHDFGENYLQEALAKITALRDATLTWHFIGTIQSNKTRIIAENFAWTHSVDRIKIAQRLNDMRPDNLPELNICIQVNISAEASKSGIRPQQCREFANSIKIMPRLRLRGLMTMPRASDNFDEQRQAFRALRHCHEQLNAEGHRLDTLSMGTTSDIEAAIAEGATIVRIGTAVFGPRDR